MTEDHYRFEVSVPPGVQSKLRIQERHLVRRREELRRQSYQGLQRFLRQGLIDQQTQARVAELLALWEQVADHEEAIKRTEQERQKLYKAQQQIQGNMGALSTTGKEGALRARYVDQLEDSEDRLRTLDGRESDLKAKIEGLKREIENRLQAFDQTGPES
jgi:chromosome segregation ATPase